MKQNHLEQLNLLIEDQSNYQDFIVFVHHLLKNGWEDAEDVVHKVFLKLLEKAKKQTLKKETTITPQYFKACLKNYVFGHFRTKQSKVSNQTSQYGDEFLYDNQGQEKSYAELFEHLNYIILRLCKLSDTEKKIWEAYRDGLKPNEIEKKLGYKNASQRKNRILKKVRSHIPKELFNELQEIFLELQVNPDDAYKVPKEEILLW